MGNEALEPWNRVPDTRHVLARLPGFEPFHRFLSKPLELLSFLRFQAPVFKVSGRSKKAPSETSLKRLAAVLAVSRWSAVGSWWGGGRGIGCHLATRMSCRCCCW